MANPIPDGFTSVTPHLCIEGAAEAIEFYKNAFGAQEIMRMPMGDKIMHAEIMIGGAIIMLADDFPEMNEGQTRSPKQLGASTCSVHLYVEDCDAAFKQAVDAGAQVKMPPMDMFWGDRFSCVVDPWGHDWSIATHTKDMTPEEIGKAAEAWMQQMGGEGCTGAQGD